MNDMIMPLEPISKDFLYMKIADAIQSYINLNNLCPGDKIPSERVLAEQFRTGRNSVREALRVLENEKIIEVKPGRGAFVASSNTSDSVFIRLFKINYIELMKVKSLLEREVVREASKTFAPDGWNVRIERALTMLENEALQGIYSAEYDVMFHNELSSLSENKTLAQMVRNLIQTLNDYAQHVDDSVEQIWITTVPYHRRMLESIRQRDAESACISHEKILEIDIFAFTSTSRKIKG